MELTEIVYVYFVIVSLSLFVDYIHLFSNAIDLLLACHVVDSLSSC